MATLTDNLNRLLREAKPYTETPPIPEEMSLDIYSGCNQACLFCPNRLQTKVAPVMPLDKAAAWLAEARALGVVRLGLHAKGEPFLVKRLEEYVAAAAGLGFRDIYLTTNGVAATPGRLRRVVEAGLTSIKFSINGFGRENYRLIHGEDQYRRAIANLHAAVALKERFPLAVYLSCVETVLTKGDTARLRAEFENLVDEVVAYDCSSFCGYLDIAALNPAPQSRPRCNLPFAKIHITPEGYLSACCGDYNNYLAVADLHGSSIAEAWASEAFRELRRRHIADHLQGLICDPCMHGRRIGASVEPLVTALANPLPPDFWTADDIHGLIAERRIRWQKP
jgi:pyruvate-formate lyase-activating enzyme